MNFLPVYLDASALVKLMLPEPETKALLAALDRWPDRVSSAVARVEVHRVVWRSGGSRALRLRADAVISAITLLHVDESVLARAASFRDPMLRAFDAIHLAAALSLGDDPDAFITYDVRLGKAAAKQRLRVESPGVEGM